MVTEPILCLICTTIQPIASGFSICDTCKVVARANYQKELRHEVEAKLKLEAEAERLAKQAVRLARKNLKIAIRDRVRVGRAYSGHSSHTWALSKNAYRFRAFDERVVKEVSNEIPFCATERPTEPFIPAKVNTVVKKPHNQARKFAIVYPETPLNFKDRLRLFN